MDVQAFVDFKKKVTAECSKVIVGKEDAIEKVLISYLCGGHVLLEDVPGTGKTMLLRAFARCVGGSFRRIQFTPDLLPSDLTGIHFYNQEKGAFQFRQGPLFANVVLADEINRATPRTQSSLLEAMEEHQITVDGTTFPLEPPFFVMATQNPLESSGTFPLPEAQIDRFFMRLSLGYMTRQQELSVLFRPAAASLLDTVETVTDEQEVSRLQAMIREVEVSPVVAGYLMDLVERTRTAGGDVAGVSTRGALALFRACQVCAAFRGRTYVIPEDVQDMAPAVLAHRIAGGLGTRQEAEDYIRRLFLDIQVPMESVK